MDNISIFIEEGVCKNAIENLFAMTIPSFLFIAPFIFGAKKLGKRCGKPHRLQAIGRDCRCQ